MRTRVTITTAGLLATLTASTAFAAPYTFQTIPVPVANAGLVNGINDAGQIVGTTTSTYQPFIETLLTGAIMQYPRSGFATYGQAINNNGLITGAYAVSGSDIEYIRNTITGSFSFYTLFNGFMQDSNATGINDAGVIVGYVTGGYHSGLGDTSFIFDPATNNLTSLVDPSTGRLNGFYNTNPLLNGYTDASDINNAGQIVGTTLLPTQAGTVAPAGFIFDEATGLFTHLTVPGSSATSALGINDNGQIVGSYVSNAISYGYLYDQSTGLYTTLTDLDGAATAATGINNAGQIVGQYTDANGNGQNFLATPAAMTSVPEPASIALLAVGICFITLNRRRP